MLDGIILGSSVRYSVGFSEGFKCGKLDGIPDVNSLGK